MEKITRLLFGIAIISLLIEGFLCLGYAMHTGLNIVSSEEEQLPVCLMVALAVSGIIFAVTLLIICIFQVSYIYKVHGKFGIFITVVVLVVVFIGSVLFNKVLLEEVNFLKNSFILTIGVMSFGLMLCYFKRIKKEK